MELETVGRAITASRKILNAPHLDNKDIHILYNSNNLVLHFRSLSAVVKIVSHLEADKNLELLVATHLQKMGVSSIAPFSGLPVKVYAEDGFKMTFWDYFEGKSLAAPDRARSLALIQKLHEALASFQLESMPRFDAKLDEHLRSLGSESLEMPGLSTRDRQFLLRLLEELKAQLSHNPSVKLGVIHGDCRPDNLLWNKSGVAKWIDFESTSFGPIAWDYVSFFNPKDEALNPHLSTVELLADFADASATMRYWKKQNRTPPVQKAAEEYLLKLRQKHPNT